MDAPPAAVHDGSRQHSETSSGTACRRRLVRSVVRYQKHGRPLRAPSLHVQELGHPGWRAGADRSGRVQGRTGPLSPLRLVRMPLGAPDAHLPQAQTARAHDRALGRALAHGGKRLDVCRSARCGAGPYPQRPLPPRDLHTSAAAITRDVSPCRCSGTSRRIRL